MKTNKEIRAMAAAALSGGWSGRVLSAGILLYALALVAGLAVAAAYRDMEVQTWTDFLTAKIENAQRGLGYSVPSDAVFWRMTGASMFQQFMMYVFGAIFAFGMARLMLKAVKNDAQGWFAASFGGFARPLEVTWLLVLMNMRIFLWSLLLVVPGVIATYRYRQAWYLKSDNPDWSAGKCLEASGRMMRGFKWQAFCLDASYVVQLILVWMVLMVSIVLATGLGGMKSVIVAFAAFCVAALAGCVMLGILLRFFAARAVFYSSIPPVSGPKPADGSVAGGNVDCGVEI